MPTKVLITAWNAYPAVNPAAGGAIGGLETFAWSIARQLAKSDEFQVTFCVRETRMPRSHLVDNVQLLSVVEPLRKIRHTVSREFTVSKSLRGQIDEQAVFLHGHSLCSALFRTAIAW